MKSNLLFSIILGICCLYTSAFAIPPNTGEITGTVFIDENEPAVFATIFVTHADTSLLVKAGTTDENGNFQIPQHSARSCPV